MRFLLVHSPLVGPATWRWVAEALRSWGHSVTVPDLTEAAATGAPNALIGAAIPPKATETLVVVGHSGAGFFLPSIGAGLEAPASGLVSSMPAYHQAKGEPLRVPTSSIGFAPSPRHGWRSAELVDLVGRRRHGDARSR